MPIYKKISELSKVKSIDGSDVFLMETSEGAKKVPLDTVRDNIVYGSAAAHNAIFRGKDLTNLYTVDEICARIAAGTFEDLFIGDYFDVTISTSYTASEVVRCVIAGFNTYLKNGDTSLATPHAVIVPKNCFSKAHPMNTSADTENLVHTTVGAYANSEMHKTVLPVYYEGLQTALNNHILTYRNLLSIAISETGDSMAGAGYTGYSNNWEWQDCNLCLLSEIQVYGSNVFSSSFYDTGIQNLQLPLFKLNPNAKVAGQGGTGDGRMWYWLKNVASASSFANVNFNGSSNYYGAAHSGGVRPHFLIG